MHVRTFIVSGLVAGSLASAAAVRAAQELDNLSGFSFTPLRASAECVPGGAGAFPHERPFLLPRGFTQVVIAREGDGGSTDNWDMNTVNETGPDAGRFLYRSHETVSHGQVTVTDLRTGVTRVLVEREDWNRMDGIVWTPWRTLLVAEEMRPLREPSLPDPDNPDALAGLVFEVNPRTGATVARPALGAKAHEGIRFDSHGNVYGISETAPSTMVGTPPQSRPGGYIFKFAPDRPGDLSQGQLYALKVVRSSADRTGRAVWLPLDRDAVRIDADAAATAAGATGYGRPEDVELATSTGDDRNPGENLYVAVTDEHRVLKIRLYGEGATQTAFVADYVRRGKNAPNAFANPDNLALDRAGNLYITEDTATPRGMDIWVARPSQRYRNRALNLQRFASLTDCTAEPSGIYFSPSGHSLYVHALHRAGDDLAIRITQE